MTPGPAAAASGFGASPFHQKAIHAALQGLSCSQVEAKLCSFCSHDSSNQRTRCERDARIYSSLAISTSTSLSRSSIPSVHFHSSSLLALKSINSGRTCDTRQLRASRSLVTARRTCSRMNAVGGRASAGVVGQLLVETTRSTGSISLKACRTILQNVVQLLQPISVPSLSS